MKLLVISLSIVSATGLRICDKAEGGAAAGASAEVAEKSEGSAAASVTAAAAQRASVEARLGGQMVLVGDFSVEVALHRSGAVLALVHDASGKLLTEGVKLGVEARAEGDAKADVDLKFDAPHACFRGQADAGVGLESGPIEVSLEIDGKALTGELALAVALPAPRFGGAVVVAGDFAVELVAKGPELQAFVFDASGKAHAAGDLDLSVAVGADAKSNVKLVWDAPSLSYKGKVDLAAGADLALQPLKLDLKAEGKVVAAALGSIKSVAALQADAKLAADLDAKAKLAGAADAKAKLAADAKVKAPSAKVKADLKVAPPKIDVKKSASASAKTEGGTKAGAKAGGSISFGTK